MRPRHQAWRHVAITGASSGIGAALARALAVPGMRLALAGRDAARLEAVAAACRTAGALAEATSFDVRDGARLHAWIAAADAVRPLDLVIANAGVGRRPADELIAVNVQAAVETVTAALRVMEPRGRGQIALMSSLASFRGLPSAPAYCASKAAVRVYGEGLRGRLLARGIALSVVCPGFVATPMTADNPFPMPLLMSAERAAGIILRGLARCRARIAFPLRLYLAIRLLAALPPALTDRTLARVAAKE
jgi:short-subunit dehydrogenase